MDNCNKSGHDCCMYLFTTLVLTLFIEGLTFGMFMLILLVFAEYTDNCLHALFHCETKTYLITTGTFLGVILLCVCIANADCIYRYIRRRYLIGEHSDEDFSYKVIEN